jgi:hypothetical protein
VARPPILALNGSALHRFIRPAVAANSEDEHGGTGFLLVALPALKTTRYQT